MAGNGAIAGSSSVTGVSTAAGVIVPGSNVVGSSTAPTTSSYPLAMDCDPPATVSLGGHHAGGSAAARYGNTAVSASGAAPAPSHYHRSRYLAQQQQQHQQAQQGQHLQGSASHLGSSALVVGGGGGHKSYAPASLPLDLGSHMASSLGGLVIPDHHAPAAMSGSFLAHNLSMPPGGGVVGPGSIGGMPVGGAVGYAPFSVNEAMLMAAAAASSGVGGNVGPLGGGNSLGVIGGPIGVGSVSTVGPASLVVGGSAAAAGVGQLNGYV